MRQEAPQRQNAIVNWWSEKGGGPFAKKDKLAGNRGYVQTHYLRSITQYAPLAPPLPKRGDFLKMGKNAGRKREARTAAVVEAARHFVEKNPPTKASPLTKVREKFYLSRGSASRISLRIPR